MASTLNHLQSCQALAAATLIRILQQGKNLQEAFALELHQHQPDTNARAAAQDCIYGVLRHWGEIRFYLQHLLKTPPPDPVYYLLAVAIYQIVYTKEHAHAIVDQAVEGGPSRFKPLINGVLRQWLRQQSELQVQMRQDLAAEMNHSSWWIRRLQKAYPKQWKSILRSSLLHPPMTLRVNLLRCTAEDYLTCLTEHGLSGEILGPCTIMLSKAVPIQKLPKFSEGWVSVQDWGAQHAASWLNPTAEMRVLDACAAPGGKTGHLLEYGVQHLVALEVDERRSKKIAENLQRLQLHAELKVGDARRPDSWWDGQPFDRILADVPCSASGVVRRNPDIKWHRQAKDIAQFAHTQRDIMDALWPLLQVGGQMLYLTCSVFAEENQHQVDAFLSRHTDVRLLNTQTWLPQAQHDGFYYALLEKMA